ncbi:MAG TPA: sulfotransferase, partial [Woeseiaceae bacterium]|nr:sulfotransferase [Woeseiaceae bacterium]
RPSLPNRNTKHVNHPTSRTDELSLKARMLARAADWNGVDACAKQILKLDKGSAEGHFLSGLAAKARSRGEAAEKSFLRAIRQDPRRYDAAVELAEIYVKSQRNSEALALLDRFVPLLGKSPLYLDMAAQAFSRLDLHEKAWPLYEAASSLQPEIERFQSGLAETAVFLGKTEVARRIYRELLQKYPKHQRYHYQLSKLAKARDSGHIEQMEAVLKSTPQPPPRNIFLYYALGKELEDLERWDEAFRYFELAGNAAKSVSPYDVSTDLTLVDTVISACDAQWMRTAPGGRAAGDSQKVPIFIVGLPRSGTTLTERIVSSHSRVRSISETFFMQMAVRLESGVQTSDSMNADVIRAAAACKPESIAGRYFDAIRYKLGDEPMFVEKLPENYLYLGFIAKGMPDARMVHLRRNPMDSCFAMFKQSYFRYAYTLDDVGRYYVAYSRLMEHWRTLLGDRLIEVTYEDLVSNQEHETRVLLERLGLEFEPACLEFEKNTAASNTASAVQVRESMHTRSVNRWRRFEKHLQPLKSYLEEQGIPL